MNQVSFANLLGVHPLTVSKWECDVLTPSGYQEAMMTTFEIAQKKFNDIGKRVLNQMYNNGISTALHTLFSAACLDK